MGGFSKLMNRLLHLHNIIVVIANNWVYKFNQHFVVTELNETHYKFMLEVILLKTHLWKLLIYGENNNREA